MQTRCRMERLGTDYGGWHLCPDKLNEKSIVYSFGVGTDISFDLAFIKRFGTNVHAFDPTPESIKWVKAQSLPAEFHLHEWGLADYDGTAQFAPPSVEGNISHTLLARPETADRSITVPVYRLQSVMEKLGHSRIDLLKMDIEGAEYTAIDDILKSGVPISQFLIEFHHRWANIGTQKTKDTIGLLNHHGFQLFHTSAGGWEFSFIKT